MQAAHDRGTVSDEVLGRTGHALRPVPGTGPELPEGVSLADKLNLFLLPALYLLARGSAPLGPGDT